MRLAIPVTLIALAACGDTDPDSPGFTFTLQVIRGEPTDRPLADPAPAFLIDGVETLRLEVEYESAVLAFIHPHAITVRHGDTIVASMDVVSEAGGCLERVVEPIRYEKTFCGYESGDLRFGSEEAFGSDGSACVGDGFCLPPCFPMDATCAAGARCTSRVTSSVPVASHLGCAPIGAVQLGQACTWIADPAGDYDDCGDGLLCVDAICRAACRPGAEACAGCAFVPGHAPEIGICP